MRMIHAVLMGFITGAAGCGGKPSPTDRTPVLSPDLPLDENLAPVAFIAGHWAGEHDNGVIEENWLSASGGTMIGTGRLILGERTAFFEYLRIEHRRDGSIVYIAQPKGRSPGTEFTLTHSSEREVVFENPEHDNPKLIRYTLSTDGKTLTAVTEGESNGRTSRHEMVMQRKR